MKTENLTAEQIGTMLSLLETTLKEKGINGGDAAKYMLAASVRLAAKTMALQEFMATLDALLLAAGVDLFKVVNDNRDQIDNIPPTEKKILN